MFKVSNKDFNDILIIISKSLSGYTSFYNEFIPEINDTQSFTIFGDCEPLFNSDLITRHDRLFTPWLNQDYEPPTKNFANYQTKIIPVLNQYIDLRNNIETNTLVPYPLNQDSEGNRFVLKSLIDLAFRNKNSNEWLIFCNFNYSDFEILNHINKHLTQIDKVAILMDDEFQLDEMNFGTKEIITDNDMFKAIQVKKLVGI